MAAKAKSSAAGPMMRKKPKVKRKGIHAKTKMSKNKKSKLYSKKYRGQGH